ncbi:hypothetical protein DI487_09095 [Flavobacterium sediminis]|uniref:Ig-like domain-containing protein n=1 Tax=Flavobacterium sediminis TaxID=2201181 RepID=A0A2U8QVS7_9FLAO|nr:T9SS type B sorting domain-containing protein [Flavobacterium sediminis]AWM13996.1 hypothetical protein DI487_09095 [Flavobacterium sediminis]
MNAQGSCSDIQPVEVTINPTPSLVITDPASVCSPTTIDITDPAVTAGSTLGGTLSYWEDAAGTIAVSDPTAIDVSGTYYIMSSLGSCSDIQPVVVTINATPSLVITDPSAVCSPNTVDITDPAVTSGSTNLGTFSYWEDAAATVAVSDPTAIDISGTYYIMNAQGSCSDIQPVEVTINPTPSLVITDPASVCSPTTIDITDPAVTAGSTLGGTLSYWEDAAGTIVVSDPTAIDVSGTYYIMSSLGSCSDIQPVTVTINSVPGFVVNDPASVCTPSTVDITDPAVTSGSTTIGTLSYWEDAAATVAVSDPTAIDAGGTYYIMNSVNGCAAMEAVNVTINASPTFVSISNNSPICSGETATFYVEGTANAYVAYTIDGGSSTQVQLDTSGQGSISVNNATSDVVVNIISIDNGCTVVVGQNSTVTVNPLPSITSVTNDGPVCEGTSGSFTITGTPGSEVEYTLNGTPGSVTLSSSGTGSVPVANVTVDQNLELSMITNLSTTCSSTVGNSSTLSVLPLPTASISAQSSAVCLNGATFLDFSGTPNATIEFTDGASTYQVQLDASGSYTNWATPDLTVDTTYTLVSVTSLTTPACVQPLGDNVTITINPTPSISDLVYSDQICNGTSTDISFTLNNTTSYYWSATIVNIDNTTYVQGGDETVAINQVVNLQDLLEVGYITVQITPVLSGGSCSGIEEEFTIQVNPMPDPANIDINIASVSVCSGDVVEVNISGLPTGMDFNWVAQTSGLSTTGSTSGTTDSTISLPFTVNDPMQSGTVYFEITPVLGTCVGPVIVSDTITVNPIPGSILEPTVAPEICSGEIVYDDLDIYVGYPNITGVEVYWEVQDAVGVTGALPGNTNVLPAEIPDQLFTTSDSQGYVIYKVWTQLGSCMGEIKYITVYVNPLPEPVLEDSAICVEQVSGVVYQTTILNAGDFSGGNYQFEWFMDDGSGPVSVATLSNDSTLEVSEAASYYVVVTNLDTNCEGISNTVVVEETNPATNIVTTVTDAFTDSATVVVTVSGGNNGDYLYQLDEESLQSSNVFTGVSSGEHQITVVDTQGCTFLQDTVTVIDYPKYFTPNGDGIHDTWNIVGLNATDNTKIYIFDRYGKLIKQISPEGEGWDGTYNGHPLPSTDYWFSVEYLENQVVKEFKAHFSLKR